jgi:regulatory protein
MLARRELSEAQIRERLARHGHSRDHVESATIRLKDQGAIDDVRVAHAIARTQVFVKRRGRIRVRRAIEAIGIARATARQVVDEVFGEVDGRELLERALAARLGQGRQIRDEREFQRLYRFLVTQGFEADQVMRALSERCNEKPEA